MSTQQKLSLGPKPIDRVAARVAKKAKPEELWAPSPKFHENYSFSREVLPIAPVPKSAQGAERLFGQRRDRLTIVGYAADQPKSKNGTARWVVRCDCGNYEHRTKILRWLGTQAPDACCECRKRLHRIGRRWPSEAAERMPVFTGGTPQRRS